jgi:hypothetical protein
MSKEVFIKMRESEFNEIPNEIKERYFNSKNVSKETNDWNENMKDNMYQRLYSESKKAKKLLSEREFQLREERRKINK